MPYCPKCGAEVPEGAQFCPTCGQDLKAQKVEEVKQENKQESVKPAQKPANHFVLNIVAVVGILAITLVNCIGHPGKPFVFFVPVFSLIFLVWPILLLIDGIKKRKVLWIVFGAVGILIVLSCLSVNLTEMTLILSLPEA